MLFNPQLQRSSQKGEGNNPQGKKKLSKALLAGLKKHGALRGACFMGGKLKGACLNLPLASKRKDSGTRSRLKPNLVQSQSLFFLKVADFSDGKMNCLFKKAQNLDIFCVIIDLRY